MTEENKKAGIFNADWYERIYPDVPAAGDTAFYHYMRHGHEEGRNPGPNFDTHFYLTTYPDVVSSGMNPIVHYVLHGRAEGRLCKGSGAGYSATASGEARHVIVKEMSFPSGGDAAVLVAHAPAGRLKPHVLPYMEHLVRSGCSVLLVAVSDRPLEFLDDELAVASGVIVRENAGYDFGAWGHAFQIYPALFGAGLLMIVRRQNILHNSRRKLAECSPRLSVDVMRRACGVASGDVRWFVA